MDKNKQFLSKEEKTKMLATEKKIKQLELLRESREIMKDKERHYSEIYNALFLFDRTKNPHDIAKMFLEGRNKLNAKYKISDESYPIIIKLAIRDFFLLILLDHRQLFNESAELQAIHKNVMFNENHATEDDLTAITNWCTSLIKE